MKIFKEFFQKTKGKYGQKPKSRLGVVSGSALVDVLIFSSISIVLISGIITGTVNVIHSAQNAAYSEEAFEIAESGVEYYRWHLAFAPTDYQDGNATSSSAYVHNFMDENGNIIGTFSLHIIPPPNGSTIVYVQSTGSVNAAPSVTREIQTELAKPSLAQYQMVTNSVVYYGSGDQVFGPIFSNAGVGFFSGNPEPIAHNTVSSAVSTFTDSNGTHFGVYTSVPSADPTPPASVPNRPDVFLGGRKFPVPAVDFTGLTANLSQLQASAQTSSGFYRGASGGNGYEVVLQTNGTFNLYKVNSLLAAPSGCGNSQSQTGWGTWSINTGSGATTLLGNYPYPANGVMFFGDNVWVQGQINGQRLTIAVGTFPDNVNTRKNIIVNNNVTYTNFNGTDVLALIAQGNFLVGMASANNLTIDGALVAQEGQTIRYYYGSNCGAYSVLSSLTTYGMMASYGQGYFYYGSSGYASQPATYDSNLLYAPPPSFPLSSNQYQTLSWQELK
jgi:hypothetical protein